MFYNIPKDKLETFTRALNDIVEVYDGQVFAADMLITPCKNMSFCLDEKLEASFNSTARTDQEKSLLWRLHVLTWAATHALQIAGDFVECGVFHGFSSAVICKYLDFEAVEKQFYLYDTFAGLPQETSTEEERTVYCYDAYDSAAVFSHVNKTFSPYPNVHIVKGIVPYSFAEKVPDQISYLHIDMNSTQAEILALEALFDRVSIGGLIVLDDFGWINHRQQMLAETEFMQKRGHHVLELPTGQGLIIKH
ncbi:TylF/MycF/NovP-related O-methyltransferase [Stenomitos frigidus]|uniref:Methyltransferase n=1 Tax=Stenomitos frigidus ULC18 TaxID=2107698 RepID=A0A2T1E3T6_9CYAN|nr:TylF/MycF/NovP-related O-methyltransferase [Stenomitos frigidus]PSB27400.1 methyltransferase [Stenomitos frigidus ULC18]